MQEWVLPGLPPGCHIRPASNGWCIMLWEHMHKDISLTARNETGRADALAEEPLHRYDPTMPGFYDAHVAPFFNPMYPEFAIRAMSSGVPGLLDYVGELGRRDVFVDGGYYTYAHDRLPIVGPVEDVDGYHIAAGVAGFGIMAAMGVGEMILRGIEDGRSAEQAFCPSRLAHIEKGCQNTEDVAIGGAL
eukprot:g2317.t1